MSIGPILTCTNCGWTGSGHTLCPRCTEPLRCEDGLHAFTIIRDKIAIGKRCMVCGLEEWIFRPNTRTQDRE